MRKLFLICFLATAGVVHASPNVLFLAVDDWNDMMNAMGKPQVKTPNLDRLAERGMVFTNAHAPGVYCAPSRTAIMTGLQPFNSGCYGDEPSIYNLPDHMDLPQYFRANGYKVAGGGKVYHHMPGYLDRRGFDEWFIWNDELKKEGWHIDHWAPGSPALPENERPYSEVARATKWKEFDFHAMPNGDEEKMADTITANWAVDFLNRKHDQPFFLAFGTYAPHKPNYVPQKYFDLYPLDQIELPPIQAGDIDDLPPAITRRLVNRAKRVHDPIASGNHWKSAMQGYFAACSYADAMMGRVLDALWNSPYADNTIIVLWSDNGYHLGEKKYWAKHTLWERTTNVPFFWAGPGIPKGKTTDLTVSLLDAQKTLIDLCNLPPRSDIDGESLKPIFQDLENVKDRTLVIADYDSYAVVNRDWRYISRPDGEELYDLRKDPNEWSNLAGHPEYADLKKKFAEKIPKNPAPAGKGPKSKTLRLVREGEDFYWVPRNK